MWFMLSRLSPEVASKLTRLTFRLLSWARLETLASLPLYYRTWVTELGQGLRDPTTILR